MDTLALLGSAAGLGFLAGIRLYFTVFALGLAIRLGWFTPNADMSQLALLAETPVLLGSGALLIAEFVADKIPWFDSLWDSVHTFIRPVGAAALGIAAVGDLNPSASVLVGLLSGGVAFTGHASKAAARAAVNHSPEPVSNWLLSFAEDVFVPFGLWVAIEYPVVTAVLVVLFLILFVVVVRSVWRLFRLMFFRVRSVAAR